jgi:hypothetical protein
MAKDDQAERRTRAKHLREQIAQLIKHGSKTLPTPSRPRRNQKKSDATHDEEDRVVERSPRAFIAERMREVRQQESRRENVKDV